jgi:hypothetical protein
MYVLGFNVGLLLINISVCVFHSCRYEQLANNKLDLPELVMEQHRK